MYRTRVEFFFLSRIARRKEKEILVLAYIVESFFQDAKINFDKVTYCINPQPGHDAHGFCWETPIGITLWLKEKPALSMGFEWRGSDLCIRQLQGMAGTVLPEGYKRWPKIFVYACLAYARESKVCKVRYYRAHTSWFFEYASLEVKDGETADEAKQKHQSRMKRRYDWLAKEMKFKMRKHWGEWINPNYARS
jgi:hypothetical protein